MTLLDAALSYAARGWRVFPVCTIVAGRCSCMKFGCDRQGKHPLTEHGLNDASTDPKTISDWWTSWPAANIGIATGASSGLVVLDVDAGKGGEDSLERLGKMPDTVEVLTGGGGRHFYFKHPGKPIKNSVCRLGAGLDVRGDGGYVVAPPSVHKSGRHYEWEASSEPGMVDPAPVPSVVLKASEQSAERKTTNDPPDPIREGTRNQTLATMAGAMRRKGMSKAAIQAALLAENDSRCVPPLTVEEVEKIAWSVSRYAPANAPREEPPPPTDEDSPRVRGDDDPEEEEPVRKTYRNLCRILREPEKRRLVLGDTPLEFNEMIGCPTIGRRPIADVDYGRYREIIEQKFVGKKGGLRFNTADIAQAVHQIAYEAPFHPVRNYLSALTWDGVLRIGTLLDDVLDSPRTDLSQNLLRRWFVSAVARAMRPGCKVDSTLILVGRQGAGKSRFFQTLAGEWFSDTAFDVASKDSYMVLSRSWIVEWAELEAMQRARDSGAVKSFLTSQTDRFRPPYARETVEIPRSCVIVGTTNEREFLTDSTGNRRYWPVQSGDSINVNVLADQRDQLWAEARVAYESGEHWHLTRELEEQLTERNQEHEVRDAWADMVISFAESYQSTSLPLSTGLILDLAIKKLPGQWTKADQMRVARILESHGWESKRRRDGEARVREWVKIPHSEPLSQPSQPVPTSIFGGRDRFSNVNPRTS